MTHKTVNQIYLKICYRLAQDCQRESPFSSKVEVDESYFGARQVRRKHGLEAAGNTIVFGVFKGNGKVYTISQTFSRQALGKRIFKYGFKYQWH